MSTDKTTSYGRVTPNDNDDGDDDGDNDDNDDDDDDDDDDKLTPVRKYPISTLLYYIHRHCYIEIAFFIRSDSDQELARTYVIIKYMKQRQTRQFKDISRGLDPIKNLL
uniref:Uncharacterized protein n=1 Tax=Vespula pensylvanica TaxID=30213 RepID=A0A834PAI4_VESPE|nr:hypothetical protein H0235_002707 [Vespula pensylvanica]